MAVIALEELEDQLNCSICLDVYTNPKQLQCHHVYCQQCLVKLVNKDQQGQLILSCPKCRQVTTLPAEGVAGLQSAFRVNQLLEIVEEHKKTKVGPGEVTGVAVHGYSCLEHRGREVELYCVTCGKKICYKCIVKGGKHHSHDYEEMSEAFERHKGEIFSSLEPIEKQLIAIKKALGQLDARCVEVTNQRGAIEVDIHNAIMRLHETLDFRKTELINQLHQLTQAKLKSLAIQREQLEATQAQLSSCLQFVKETLVTDKPGDELLKNTIISQVKELTTTFQPDMLQPNTEANMIFTTLASLTADCLCYGQVLMAVDSPDPSKCFATGKGVEVATVGEKSTAFLQILNLENQPCKVSATSIACELASEITGTRTRGNVDRKGENQYEISYQPTIKGKHQLHIKVEDQHIRGSPFPILTVSPVEELGTPILTIGGVKGPEGIALNHSGEVVVTECGGHRVSVFSPSGEKIRSFGEHGSGEGQFLYPCGVGVDGEGNILVADNNNHRIQKFTAQGEFIMAVGSEGKGPLQFSGPCGIALNASRVYIGSSNGSIQVLNSDLSYFGMFGKEGSGKGQLNNPRHIACDSTGNVYTADSDNHRIQAFVADGKFLRVFGRRGNSRGDLTCPYGVTLDSSGRVYVSDCENHSVSVFTSEGQFVVSFGSKGRGAGEFKYPCGLAVDSSGVVYVCDHCNNRVQLF